MKIVGCKIYQCFIELAQPLSISFHTFHQHENYIVELISESGLSGFGEGAPFAPITGDDISQVRREALLMGGLLGEFLDPVNFYQSVSAAIKSSSLRAALDCAFIDLLAKEKEIPAYQLFTDKLVEPPPNSVTVFIRESEAESIQETERILNLHPHLKVLKIKLKGSGDISRIKAIKSACHKPLSFILDANQGFKSAPQAINELSAIISILGDVLLIEEPCPRYEHELAKQVRIGLGGVPIVADESCTTMKDLEKIIELDSFAGINIKIQKIGGITAGLLLARRALEHNLVVMIGQMFEGPLGSAAGLHLALAARGVSVTDLDMDLDLPETCNRKLPFARGARQLTGNPGLGVAPDFQKLAELAKSGKIQFEQW